MIQSLRVSLQKCEAENVLIVDNPLPENEYHAFILKSLQENRLSESQEKNRLEAYQ